MRQSFFGDTSSNEYCQIASDIQVPEPYRNLALIMAAESSRRRRMVDEIENCLLACTNVSFRQACVRPGDLAC